MRFLKTKLLIFALVIFAASSAFALPSYDVTINTSAFAGSSGYLYMQYDQAGASVASSTATVSSFFTNGVLGLQDKVDVVNGSAVTGTLPGPVVFANTNGINDYNQAVTSFGSTISFDVFFGNLGAGVPAGGSSTFSFGLFADAAGTQPLLNVNGGNLAGTAFTLNLNNDGTSTAEVLAPQATVPVPAAAWLLGSGLTGLVAIRRRMKK
jgi:hypothetical protein